MTEEEIRRIAEALTKYDEQASTAGSCSDGYCVVKRPKGQHTNGGCRCWQDKYKAQRMMHAGQALGNAVRAALTFPAPAPEPVQELHELPADQVVDVNKVIAPAPDVAEVVERLESHMGKQDVGVLLADCRTAAALITTLSAENARMREAAASDFPEADATDAAHPAWWRGHDHTAKVFCQKVNEALDGKDDGRGLNYEPWHSTRRRLLSLVAENARLREAVTEAAVIFENIGYDEAASRARASLTPKER